jgi:tRNA nucleotidyltransferase (CCA-adding enzyme)
MLIKKQVNIPEDVKSIIDIIEAAGFEAYAVGGCVRDIFVGIEPADWDITTSAKPEEVKRLFKRTIDTGLEHGTVTIMLDDQGYEVTTYRIDGVYTDYRRPEAVHFTNELLEDLKRRDFTT